MSWWKYTKKTQTQIRSWRKKGYLNSLFRKLWIFFFDITPKLDKWQFLKGELWYGIWNHIYKCHTLLHENPFVCLELSIESSWVKSTKSLKSFNENHSIKSSRHTNGFFTHHDFVISHIGPMENLIHWVRQIFEMLTVFTVHCRKTHLLISLLILTEKS